METADQLGKRFIARKEMYGGRQQIVRAATVLLKAPAKLIKTRARKRASGREEGRERGGRRERGERQREGEGEKGEREGLLQLLYLDNSK